MLNFARRHQAATAVLGALFASSPALASAPQIEVDTPAAAKTSPGMIVFAHVPATSSTLGILVENAHVKVVRDPAAADITVASNCPHDWNIQGSLIRQAGFTRPTHGVRITADEFGQRAIVNGKIYSVPQGAANLQLGPKGVSIGGKPIEPLSGSDVPGTTEDQDAVEVTVPDSYIGNLILGMESGSAADVNSWKNGEFKCMLQGDSKLETGILSSLTKAAVDLKGNGSLGPSVRIADVSAKVLVSNVNGHGSINIENGSAQITNATVTGDGHITMRGHFDNLKQAIEGTGSIKVN
jgi:hypothetical protein